MLAAVITWLLTVSTLNRPPSSSHSDHTALALACMLSVPEGHEGCGRIRRHNGSGGRSLAVVSPAAGDGLERSVRVAEAGRSRVSFRRAWAFANFVAV